MCASSWARGVPDVSQCMDRGRLSGQMRQGGSRVCVLVAPSGYGKSVAAAQFALGYQFSVWIDASDGSIRDGWGVAHETLQALWLASSGNRSSRLAGLETIQLADILDAIESAAAALPEESICIVVDDVPNGHIGDCVLIARRMGASLRRRARFVFTARDIAGASDEIVRNCIVLGADELRLTEPEAVALLGVPSLEHACSEDAAALRLECNGHVALFSVLSRNPGIEVDGRTGSPANSSLQLWLDHLINTQLGESQREALAAMALFKKGTIANLRAIGVSFSEEDLRHVSTVLPLVTVDESRGGRTAFAVHDSVVEFSMQQSSTWLKNDAEMVRKAVPVLTARGSLVRAALVLERMGDVEACAGWLLENGSTLLDGSHSESLLRLLELIPLSTLFAQPKLLLLSAAVAAQAERYEDALARSRAALSLAEHGGDLETKVEAISRIVHCLCNLGQFDRASEISSELMRQPLDDIAQEACASALLALGIQASARGEFAESERALSRVRDLVGNEGRDSRTGMLACLFASIHPALAHGDFGLSALQLAPFIDGRHLWFTDRLGARGNLAVCLCEMGKLERARLILGEVRDQAESAGLTAISGCFLPTLGSVEAGLGRLDHGLEMLREGIRLSLNAGDEASAQVNRIYLATVLRASGAVDESLMQAERAFEHLSVVDVFRCRRLAALEVSADFLALGDVSTSMAWAQTVFDEGFDGNRYHELRGDMILAEIDRLDGRWEAAEARLALHAEYIASGSSNWQIAMYCRAFPQLLALIAGAMGAGSVPGHLLRMIPAEYAERSLRGSTASLDETTWQGLGRRFFDDATLCGLRDTEDLPVCRVRLFGGLEVSVGDRVIRERDWRKRKARVLFAMLVTRRGQDVPRDQVLEHLWPEMDEERAKNNLYVAWSTMKSVLGGEGSAGDKSPYVESTHGVCRALSAAIRSDIDEFEEALTCARKAEADRDIGAALDAYEEVAVTYRGDLLPGDVYDDWFVGIRSHYRSNYIDAMRRAAALLLSVDDGLNALAFARRAVQVDQLREDLYQMQMRCEIQAGQRSSAIDTYFHCRDRLAEELGLDPSAETRALYDQILAMEDRPVPIPLDPFSE
jgi:DNA-binding SARP family transcriptional activator